MVTSTMTSTLKVGGPRKIIEEDEAKEILARFEKRLADGNTDDGAITAIDLSCRQWTESAIVVLEEFLKKVAPQISTLELSDIIAGLETSIGLNIMGKFNDVFAGSVSSSLKSIYLNDNAMGPRALERIKPLLGSPGIDAIYLNNCGLSAETIPMIDAALRVDDGTCTDGGDDGSTSTGGGFARLRVLELNKNMIGVKGAKEVGLLLPACKKLEEFSYCGCRPESEGTKYITEGLRDMVAGASAADISHPIKKLSLWDCSVGSGEEDDDAIHSLVEMLTKSPNLTHLNLQDCGDLGETGTGMIVQALINSECRLVDLNLSKLLLVKLASSSLSSTCFFLFRRVSQILCRFPSFVVGISLYDPDRFVS
jgi:Ran GTPase-activating protein (RanGAP) involved in mRNA processing and transport